MSQFAPVVYVVDDEDSFRRFAGTLLATVGLESVPCATGGALLEAYSDERPSCVLLDVRLPDQGGLQVLAQLAERPLPPPVIVITGHADVPMAVQALKSGALEFLEKPVRNQDLLDKVQKAIAADVAGRLERMKLQEIVNRLESLSPREREVMDLVVDGVPNKAIASALGLSMKTIEFHRARVMRKMEAESSADLIRQVLIARRS
ncbi:MAG TPA: response regulator [Candidatus Krumholzibacteria bacterium]|nr:response regulator [Candidatus Krumholzibacteria bacterium]